MKTLFIAEIRNQCGTKVYEINKSDLIDQAMDALDSTEGLSEERLLREYFKLNNYHFILEENYMDFVESVVLYKGHNEVNLRKAFESSFCDITEAKESLKLFKTLLREDRLTGDETQALYDLFKPGKYKFNDLEIELLPMAFSSANSDTTYGAEVRERTSKKIVVQGWELETI